MAVVCSIKSLCSNFSKLRVDLTVVRMKMQLTNIPRYRPPNWFVQRERVASDDSLTQENKEFLQEIIQEKIENAKAVTSPLALAKNEPQPVWDPRTRRAGLIGRKIGNYPLWLKNGKKVQTTLIQVVDNHVIKYIPPENFNPMIIKNRKWKDRNVLGCLLVGSETVDPSTVTKEYCGLFDKVGMLPKRHLCRFMISPQAAMPSGTPLFATHYRAGDVVDVRAKTMDRGFQGVIKRWGFKGMPASHGVTKTHRRPGNIGAGGNKARVWPGQKMPGHMGNRWRILRGVKILRINAEHNVLWMLGVGIPGETGAMCYLYDTVLPNRKFTSAPPFPTHTPSDDLPVEYYDETVHSFESPSVTFEESI